MWRNVTPSNHPKFLVSGTELNTMLVPGLRSRYQLCEIRTYDRATKAHDRIYAVRDAHTVTDEQVREGKRPEVVRRFSYEDEALAFCWFGFSAQA